MSQYDPMSYKDSAGVQVRLWRIDGIEMTFEKIKEHCPHVSEKMIRDRLFRGERKLARLSRPPDKKSGVDKPKSWR